jgi:cell division protease FtsH
MVCEWGMSDKMGPLTFGKKDEEIFLGREIATRRDYSESTAIDIDNEVKQMVMDNYERAKNILRENIKALRAIAEALREKEVLDAPEIDKLIAGASA